MGSLVLKSPAKVNLFLNVLRKRPDGYHDIETIFEKIALFDIVTITKAPKGIGVTTDSPKLPAGRTNLAYKAADLIFKKANFKGGVHIGIKKNIPVAAGLGGGSSNAAITLLGINKLFKFGLKKQELLSLASKLGADVPFFLHKCGFALGRGRGDRVLPINSNIILWHNIISFGFGFPTRDIYEGLNLGLTPTPIDVRIPVRVLLKKNVENLAVSIYNKLEEVAIGKSQILSRVKALLLKEGSYNAILSGSGPTMFGVTKTRGEAIAVRNRVKGILGGKCRIFTVQTFNG